MKSEREKKKPKHPLSKSTTSFLYDPSNHIFSVLLPEDPGIYNEEGSEYMIQTNVYNNLSSSIVLFIIIIAII